MCTRTTGILTIFTVFSLYFATATICTAKQHTSGFHIRKVDGVTYYKLPMSAKWEEVRAGMLLPTGTLLQVQKNSEIEYTHRLDSTKGWNGEETVVRIKKPMNMILDSSQLRSTSTSSLFMDRIPEVKEYQWRISVSEYFPLLKYAWDRIGIFVDRDDTTSEYVDDLFKKAEGQNVEIGIRSGKINLLYPDHGDAEYINRYPAEVDLIWQTSKKYPGPFHIYIWSGKNTRPAPMYKTSKPYYTALFSKPGSYYVQISTADRRAWSKAHIFHLSEPMSIGNIPLEKNILEINQPPENQTFVSKKRITPVHFSWDLQPGFDYSGLVLEIDSGKSKELIPLPPTRHEFVKHLKPGKYRWRMRINLRAELGNSKLLKQAIETATRQFTVLEGNFSTGLDMFSNLVRAKTLNQSESIYIGE